MQIDYQRGDLSDASETMLIHSCNIQGVMPAASSMRQRFPLAYDVYRHSYEKNMLKLGGVIWWIDTMAPRIIGHLIAHQYCQRVVGKPSIDHAALRDAVRQVAEFVTHIRDGSLYITNGAPIDRVAMPQIGIETDEWAMVATIIERESTSFTPVVYIP